MKVLIIGAKGFIGTHLYSYLTQKNNQITACDVVIDYETPNYILIDQSNADYDDLFKSYNFDICINCSGASSVPDSVTNPQRDFYLNTINVFNMLEGIRKYQPNCKFLNLSSAAVYGNPKQLPIKETDISKPLSPYGFHKKNAELICEEFHQFYQLNTCSVRIFSAYGNGLKKQIFWDIAQKAKGSNTLTLFGTGMESRDFIHIDDIVANLELIMLKDSFTANIYNIANGVEITIEQAAKELLKALNWHGKLIFNQVVRVGDPQNWCADILKIKALGYKQKISLELGLKKYAEWLNN
ncbi:NAD-dependent epimerase/dehydratase family protein [Pedobacter glucosidilyticus]|uniref:NAD-dependent epimerase/dehydratase family protein n=1 Tax=Pedobacter glucosidilyticus TaxID=1122941 RepID=UPI0026EBA208|nr:NAD-dependent epimerase/dehydratase family protein [Pedobacter glucosidilyticus]